MGRPSTRQVAEAIVQSARTGESDAEFDVRYAGLSRLSDDELAAMGITPRPEVGTSKFPKLTKLTTPRIRLAFRSLGRFSPRLGR